MMVGGDEEEKKEGRLLKLLRATYYMVPPVPTKKVPK